MTDATSGPDDQITDTETGKVLGTVGGMVSSLAHRWADPEPGQTAEHDELRLHLLAEHDHHTALRLTDAEALTDHTARHADGAMVGHPVKRRTWNEDKIVVMTIERPGDVDLTSRWQAHYARVERSNGGPLWNRPPHPIPEIDQDIYVHAAVNENAASELAVLAIARGRLAEHFAWHPRTALAAVDVIDEIAREVVYENTETDGEDLDDEIGEDEDDG
jgi:hypothetical protein